MLNGHDGKIKAQGVEIEGKIKATSGEIGNFTLEEGYLVGYDNRHNPAIPTMGLNANADFESRDDNLAFWAGGSFNEVSRYVDNYNFPDPNFVDNRNVAYITHSGRAFFNKADIKGNITARSIITGNTLNKITLNEGHDNLLKFRHSNGVIAAEFGVINGVSAMIWYDESGTEIWRAGKNGIIYVTDVAASFTPEYMYRLTSLDSVTTLTSSNHTAIKSALSSVFCVDIKDETNIGIDFPLVAGNLVYLYSKGNNSQSNANAIYEGYHTSDIKLTNNWIPTGWYVRREYMRDEKTVHLIRYVSGQYDKDYIATLIMSNVTRICPLDMEEPN